jgi:hypothetical protein
MEDRKQILDFYEMYEPRSVMAFLIEHPTTASLLVDAIPALKKFFGDAIIVNVSTISIDGKNELFAGIKWDVNDGDAGFEIYREFRKEWLIYQVHRISGSFTFDIEPTNKEIE